jgi:hypothetical protein
MTAKAASSLAEAVPSTSLLTRAALAALVLFYLTLELSQLLQPGAAPPHACRREGALGSARARLPPPSFPASLGLPLNASALQRAALRHGQPPPPPAAAFAPLASFQHALGYQHFSPPQALRCIARAGGLALVGDSMLREVTTVLLEYLGRPRIKVQGVPWAAQRADEVFDVTLEDGSAAQARLFFRFAANIHPQLGARVAEAALELGVRAVVAHSGVWDLMPDSGASAGDGLARYQVGAARFLEGVRLALAPQLAALDASEAAAAAAAAAPLPPRRFLWRTMSPTVLARLDDTRRAALAPAALHAGNAFMREALRAAAQAAGAPPFEVVDMELLMPAGQEQLVREDGYHPTDPSALATAQVVLNMLCGPQVTAETLAQLALAE